jgi:hypothetical protein
MIWELLAVGVILLVIFIVVIYKGKAKGSIGLALIGIAFLFMLLALDPLENDPILWLICVDSGIIFGSIAKRPLPRLYLLIGFAAAFLTFLFLMMRKGFG